MSLKRLFLRWFLVGVRALVVYTLFTPALNKFTQTPQIAGYLGSLGIPAPEVTVYFLALVEVAGIVLYTLGLGGRVIAVPLIIEMIVAMSTAGINQNNTIVLLGSLIILLMGTGALSPFQPEGTALGRFR